jgi:hypothetical protein
VFHWVDALPPERRRLDLVDPRVVLTNRWFGLSMEILEDDLPVPRRVQRDRRSPAASTNLLPAVRRPAAGSVPTEAARPRP